MNKFPIFWDLISRFRIKSFPSWAQGQFWAFHAGCFLKQKDKKAKSIFSDRWYSNASSCAEKMRRLGMQPANLLTKDLSPYCRRDEKWCFSNNRMWISSSLLFVIAARLAWMYDFSVGSDMTSTQDLKQSRHNLSNQLSRISARSYAQSISRLSQCPQSLKGAQSMLSFMVSIQ